MKIERVSVCVQKKHAKDETSDKNMGLLGHLVEESVRGYITYIDIYICKCARLSLYLMISDVNQPV